ncbi:MAG: VOC family protein, partial [Cyanobacteriota bacterium]
MIGYVTLGTNKFDEAAKFYDELLAEFGAKRAMDFGTFIAWSAAKNQPMLALTLPYNKQEANF